MQPRPLLVVATCLTAVAVVTGLLLLPGGAARPGPPGGAPGPGSGSTAATALTVGALDVIREWDRRRRSAWAAGDVGRLRALYVPGSRTGRRDVQMLRAYAGRGIRVTGLRMQVRAARLVRADPSSAVVVLTERLAGAVVRRGSRSAELPRDHFSNRVVRLRRTAGEWVVAEVVDQASAAASTARTSG